MLAGRSGSELSHDQFYASDPKTLVLSCLGAMGNGKSSLLNAICDEQIYRTGRGAEPITRHVEAVMRPWSNPPVSRYCQLIDTPGMCDSSARDRANMQECVRYFKSLSFGVSAFLLVFNINDTRLDAYTQNMLSLFEQLLGREFWKYVILVFTHVDEHNRDLLEDNIDVLTDPSEGFVPELRRVFRLDERTFDPPMVFLTTQRLRYNAYAQRHLQQLYNSVVQLEKDRGNKKFTCGWFNQILSTPTEDQKSNFIISSVRGALGSIRSAFTGGGSWCAMQ
ncbi:hypothetical protein INT43_003246 [Umbelopsis isabellina]|uniref:AIG1-type G domain-containing protein n=1 Tax=Mortierella isabellina TaxID=91625 RepID=A0A8H7PPX3_MORIS|nr:hypothetical protein INT43_003246 [Umbelopsis isabellina]